MNLKYLAAVITISIFFVLQGRPQVSRTMALENLKITKISNVEGSVYQYISGDKKLISKGDKVVSGARFEVVDGIVEMLINGQMLTATAGADFTVTHKADFFDIRSNQGVPIEIRTTSGHNLVLTSRAEVEITRFENRIGISVKLGRTLMSDLRGGQDTKILNAPDIVSVTDLGLIQTETRIKKAQKSQMSEFFKRFTKEEYELFSLYDTDLKDFVFAHDAFLNNLLIGKKNYLKYFLTSAGLYDSNIYLVNTAERFAYINKTSVGLKFRQSFERSYIYGGYTLGLITYSRDHSPNNAVHHNGNIGFKIKFPGNITIAFGENYLATTKQETSEITFRTKRTKNDIGFFTEIPIKGKLGFRTGFGYINHNYLSSVFNGLDRSHMTAEAGFTYWFLPETLMYANYKYGNLDYKNSNTHDGKYHTVGLSIERQLSPEVVGKIGAGYEFIDYDSSFMLAGGQADNKPATFVFNGQIVWKPYSNSRVIIIGERKNIETNVNALTELSRYYISTLLDLSWMHKINKFDFCLGFGWEFADYPQIETSVSGRRSDQYSRFRAEILWYLNEWITAGINYNFTGRSSNMLVNEYDNHTGGVDFKLVF